MAATVPKLLSNGYSYWCENDKETVPRLDAAEAAALKESDPEKQTNIFYEKMGFKLEAAWPTDDPRLTGTVQSAYDRFDLLQMQTREFDAVVADLRNKMNEQADHPSVTGAVACWKCQKMAAGGEDARWIKMNVKSRSAADDHPLACVRVAMWCSRECKDYGWMMIRPDVYVVGGEPGTPVDCRKALSEYADEGATRPALPP